MVELDLVKVRRYSVLGWLKVQVLNGSITSFHFSENSVLTNRAEWEKMGQVAGLLSDLTVLMCLCSKDV